MTGSTVDLAAFQATSADLYARYPKSVLIAFVLVAVIGAVWLFHFLFLTPPQLKKETTRESAPPLPFNIENVEKMEVHIHQGGQVVTAPAVAPPAVGTVPFMAASLVENGGFEEGTLGWGTGFFESYFVSPPGSALGFKRAVAEWYIDDRRPHTGKRSLRIEHSTTQAPDVFSTFSQRIKVRAGQRYEVTYWAYLESTDGRGPFSIRVVPSRNIQPHEWDRFRKKIDPALIGQWQKVTREFESGTDTFFDLRFAAETKMKLWIDDVSVTSLQKE